MPTDTSLFRFLYLAFAALLIHSPMQAAAGVSNIGNGGSVIACFGIPLSEAFQKDRLTSKGVKNLVSVRVLESFQASLSKGFDPIFEVGSYEEVYAKLMEKASLVPVFASHMKQAAAYLGKIENGIQAPNGLTPLRDSHNVLLLNTNCMELQAVIRRDDQFMYDPRLISFMKTHDEGRQMAFLEWHEMIYHQATVVGQTNSINTQKLLLSMMKEELSKSDLVAKLKTYGFGQYHAQDRFKKDRSDLNWLNHRLLISIEEASAAIRENNRAEILRIQKLLSMMDELLVTTMYTKGTSWPTDLMEAAMKLEGLIARAKALIETTPYPQDINSQLESLNEEVLKVFP